MGKKAINKKEALIDDAWDITYDSIFCDVIDQSKELTKEKLEEARYKIRYIDKSDWLPIAQKLVNENPFIKEIPLAETASSIFLNKQMTTSNLKVVFRTN
ncbi:MAG TPA: hypothetical protein VL125_04475 [Pelobium sp.]|nr:hypothetical protein [Pelobium sp.]